MSRHFEYDKLLEELSEELKLGWWQKRIPMLSLLNSLQSVYFSD